MASILQLKTDAGLAPSHGYLIRVLQMLHGIQA